MITLVPSLMSASPSTKMPQLENPGPSGIVTVGGPGVHVELVLERSIYNHL